MSERPSMNAELRLFPAPPRKRDPSKKRSGSKTRSASATRTPLEERSVSPAFVEDTASQPVAAGREVHQFPDPPRSQFAPPPHSQSQSQGSDSPITIPPPVAQSFELPRSHTSLSEAPTLVGTPNASSHKLTQSPPREEPLSRSIFPRYNPDLPLEHQSYFPTQASPTHARITATQVNRRPYSPSLLERSPNGLQSPMPIGLSPGLFPRGLQDETVLEPSTNEDMKDLWKVCNGWRVSQSEGRRFCLRMTSALEEPVHTLSSATHPFYTLRLDPTSSSAIVTLTRQDPNKSKSITPRIGSSKPNTGMEVLTTTLEEYSRRLPPNDGLVALLYPRAASNMAIELATKASRSPYPPTADQSEAVIIAAERECGRLVFDHDTKKYFLIHPAMSTPFYISIHSSPAWSRSEYTLEHPELPRNLVRLVRDGKQGGGSGYLEIDSAVASRMDAFYVVDVAVAAILIVATAEEKSMGNERFDAPPPSIAPLSPLSPKLQQKADKKERKERKKREKKAASEVKFEEFDMDLESQDSLSELKRKGKQVQKGADKDGKDKVPGFFGLLWMLIKFFAWFFGLFFRGAWRVTGFVFRGCKTRKDKKERLPS